MLYISKQQHTQQCLSYQDIYLQQCSLTLDHSHTTGHQTSFQGTGLSPISRVSYFMNYKILITAQKLKC